MPKLLVYSVYDSAVKAFANPMYMRTKGEALRSWSDAANDPKTAMCQHPSDYSLMELGEYDDQTGQFINHPAPINMGLAAQFKQDNVTAIKGAN